jgi:hypothetical protein
MCCGQIEGRQQPEDRGVAHHDMEEIRDAGPTAAVRTRQLLAFSRKRTEP